MKILAIETSCDDTGIAILEVLENQNFNVLANIVSSQIEIHKKYGGVYPALAKREHQKNLVPTLVEALKKANMLKKLAKTSTKYYLGKILEREKELQKQLIPFFKKYQKPNVDLIAVTNGPGLEPCLWVGVNFAKALAYFWNLPVVEVNHVKAHMFINQLKENGKIAELTKNDFPVIYLIVSGGHTQLILMGPKGYPFGKYQIIGETRDDAAGECFDKCAQILKLGYPGGPVISKMAEGVKTKRILPRPMIGTKDYDFSFSGLKTAVLYADRKVKNKTMKYKKQMAAEVQQAIIDVLIKKTIKAAKDFKAKKLILGGGVTANKELKDQFKEKIEKENLKIDFVVPPANLSTDNGLMVAVAGYFKAKQNKFINWQDLEAKANLRVE